MHLKCTKVVNNPEKKEAVIWVKDNDDNIPGIMRLSQGTRIDLFEVWIFDKKDKLFRYNFVESNYIRTTETAMDGEFLVRKMLVTYRSMEVLG